jgi:hypothetical protein
MIIHKNTLVSPWENYEKERYTKPLLFVVAQEYFYKQKSDRASGFGKSID